MIEDEIPEINFEEHNFSETNLINGELAVLAFFEADPQGNLLIDCGYAGVPDVHPYDALSLLETQPRIEESPYTGEFSKYQRKRDPQVECQIHTVAPNAWSQGGYHFAALDKRNPDGSIFEDDPVTLEVILLKDTDPEISPTKVFLTAMNTRCGSKWQKKGWTTYTGVDVGKYTESDWVQTIPYGITATTTFRYPVSRFGTNPFQDYEIHFRNLERLSLYGVQYHAFMRMVNNPNKAVIKRELHDFRKTYGAGIDFGGFMPQLYPY